MKLPSWYLNFWQGPAVSAVQLARFRVVFFALVAIDAFLMIGHAPRYGSGGFNVPHFPSLSVVTPIFDRVAIVVCALVLCYLATRVAIGISIRWLLIPLAAIYGAIYFSSQIDSYQHHYLLVLMLITCCLIDWTPRDGEKPGVGIRLLLLQVSVVYAFAAISKMEAGWWDGRALEAMLTARPPGFATDAVTSIGFPAAAKLVVLTELFLAIAIHVRQLRIPAVLVGAGLHIGIEIAGFEIELFSYYMLAFYLLVLPPAAFRWAALPNWQWPSGRGPLLASLITAAAIGVVLVALLPLDGALTAALVIALGVIARKRRVAMAHIAAVLAIVVCSLATDAMRDHYRFLGGSSRRLGDTEGATRAYERLATIEGDYAPGRRNLGKLYLAAGRLDDAETQYRAAVRAEPKTVASQLGLARVLARLGNGPDAVYHAGLARELAEADPKSGSRAMQRAIRQAQAIERRFGGEL